jgi:8-oxo-dGTP diphosphatase
MATELVSVESPVIRAAGGIIQRSTQHGDEVMVVFRKRHQDWALPKGKVKDDESFQDAALREVEEETGCTCRLGNYLGTISYSDNGVPKVVMFWRMTVLEQKQLAGNDEIAEAVWMTVPAAIQKLAHSQEKNLLSRVSTAPRPIMQPEEDAAPDPQRPRRKASVQDERVHARVLRECEAFRVELAFLERRSGQADKSWSSAARDQLTNVVRCLDSNDIEGSLFCLHAARRFAVFGLNKSELLTRAQILREEAHKITSWHGHAIDSLLSVGDGELTAERLAEAMRLRDEESTDQYYRNRLTGDHLRILLIICSLAALAMLPLMLLSGGVRMLGPVLLFGLFGASFAACHALMKGNNDSIIPNVFVMLTPVLFGPVAGLAGFGIHEYLSGLYNFPQPHWGAMLSLSFLFGTLAQRMLARFTGQGRRQRIRPAK